MTAPDPLETVFIDYTDDTAAELRGTGTGTDRLWRKARRRRIGRTAAAGAAALALLAPAGWLLANTAGTDDRGTAPAEEQTTAPEHLLPDQDPDAIWADEVVPETGEIVGATMTLPSFGGDADAACPVEDAVIADGTFAPPGDDGAVYLKQLRIATLTGEPGAAQAVALFGCGFDGDAAFQVVVLAETAPGSGAWEAERQLARSAPGASPQYLGGGETDLVIGFAERYDATAGDLDYWFDRYWIDAAGEVRSERVSSAAPQALSHLVIDVAAAETGDGDRTLTATVRNDGPRDVADYTLTVCGLPFADTVDTDLGVAECGGEDDFTAVPVGGLAVGETFTYEWTAAVDPGQWDAYLGTVDDDALTGPVYLVAVSSGAVEDGIPPGFDRTAGEYRLDR
ncbi:hypothetical protein AB0A73_30255 [Glycomyces sp. NPDC047369]